jgi:AcrR family transcriptional regulator
MVILTDRSVKKAMSPRTAAKNKEIRQESMQKIMDAALLLIARHGYESTSIARIAKRAGVSKGLLYNYFESKEELLRALIDNMVSQGDQLMADIIDPDPRRTLENLFRWFFKEMRERPNHYRLLTELTFRIDRFRFVHDIVESKAKAYTKFLEDLLGQIGIENPEGESKVITALFDGIVIQFVVIRDQYPLKAMEDYLINKYCKTK